MGRFFGAVADQLILFVRQLAYLNTAPDKRNGQKADPPRRIDAMEAQGMTPLLPPNPAEYLTRWLLEIGPSEAGAGGEVPMAIRHIEADLAALGIETEPWELRLIRSMSSAWCAERHNARKPDARPPYIGPDTKAVRDRVSVQFEGMFKSLQARPPQGKQRA